MNFSNQAKMGVVIVLLLLITVMSYVTYRNWPECDAVDGIDTSVKIKTTGDHALLGFNTDTDALKFGAVSAGAWVKRSANAKYKYDADVKVSLTGDLASWVKIDPRNFTITPNQTQQVSFELNVPLDAADGNYTGRVIFCFKDR